MFHEHGFMSRSKWWLSCMLFLHSNISVGEVTVIPSIQYESFLPAELKFATLQIETAVCSKTVGLVCYYMQLYMLEDNDIDTHCCVNHVSDTIDHVLIDYIFDTRALAWKRLFSYQEFSRVEQISTLSWCGVLAWSWEHSCLVWMPLFLSFQSQLTDRCVP